MNTLYLETSAVLSRLLAEPGSKTIVPMIEGAEIIVTSVLTLMEANRSLACLEYSGRLKRAQRQSLAGMLQQLSADWALHEITPSVQERAGDSFPVEPVRALDAIHLATALDLLKVYPDLVVLSLDKRIRDNLEPLGLSVTIA